MSRELSTPSSSAAYVSYSSKLFAPSGGLPGPSARPWFSIASNNQIELSDEDSSSWA